MTADNSNETNGQAPEGTATKTRARKASRKRSPASGQAAKRGKAVASGRGSRAGGAQTASRGRGSRSTAAAESNSGIASRVLSRGRKAAAWAVEGASRAVPLASRSMPDQRMVQRLVDERPYMLGAIGLGIGAVIGLMLPGTLSSMSSRNSSARKSR